MATNMRLDFDATDFNGIFKCHQLESAISDLINSSMAKRKFPEIPEKINCKCRFAECTHTREQIIEILKANGIWSEIHERLKGNICSSR